MWEGRLLDRHLASRSVDMVDHIDDLPIRKVTSMPNDSRIDINHTTTPLTRATTSVCTYTLLKESTTLGNAILHVKERSQGHQFSQNGRSYLPSAIPRIFHGDA
jgi:hypothetical protein